MKDMTNLRGRFAIEGDIGDARNGIARLKIRTSSDTMEMTVMFSDGMGWDHVSVSTRIRTPRWEEMAAIKDLFFDPEDVVVQFHPRASEYVNVHKHCLHLWRCQAKEFPTPPKIMVG